ncbi:hypothetical protein [Microlunatus ginsengisoli]|uniref:Uncharacterized protein n=1 Tax=Microlunatus ginsengisoli TaxID=363863 RepID=A0ABP7ALV7_9ACTN
MEQTELADRLLAGPRGRDLCLYVSGTDPFEVITATYLAKRRPDVGGDGNRVVWMSGRLWTPDTSAALALAVAARAAVPAKKLKGRRLLETLADVVGEAAYWQPPGDQEKAADDPTVTDALRPVAAAVAAAPDAGWWTRPYLANDQPYVSWIEDERATRATPPPLTGVTDRLTEWRREAQQPGSVWWSTPNRWDVVTTAPSSRHVAAIQLALVEDSQGWHRARVARLQPRPEARVYEVGGVEDWTALVEAYPLDVGASRGRSWHALTGRDHRWLLPDWPRVAHDYDGVHLTVLAYLSGAGRALPAAGGMTVLAGWEPDVTIWLTDALSQAENPTTWIATQPTRSTTRWRPA